jgi:AAA domain
MVTREDFNHPVRRGRQAGLTTASAIRSERVRWLWEQRIPRRAVVVVAGEKGLGKSVLTNTHLTALATRGQLDGELTGPIDVAIATAEDDWSTVVVPRLRAHDADLDRVHRVDLTDDAGSSLLTLPDDVGALEDALADLTRRTGRAVGLLVADPITAFLSNGIDSHKDASVRRALAPLAALAIRCDLSVVVVAHLTKDENARLLSRVSGSGAFVNAARAVMVFARDPSDPLGERGSQRVLVMAASNWGVLAPSLAAHIESKTVLLDDGVSEQPLLLIDGETDVHPSDLQRGASETGGDDVADAIITALRDGPREAREVKGEVAAQLDVSRRTVERGADRLEGEGLLLRSKSGFPAVATWTVATPPDATPVATGGNGATARVSPSGSASGDTALVSSRLSPLSDGDLPAGWALDDLDELIAGGEPA